MISCFDGCHLDAGVLVNFLVRVLCGMRLISSVYKYEFR